MKPIRNCNLDEFKNFVYRSLHKAQHIRGGTTARNLIKLPKTIYKSEYFFNKFVSNVKKYPKVMSPEQYEMYLEDRMPEDMFIAMITEVLVERMKGEREKLSDAYRAAHSDFVDLFVEDDVEFPDDILEFA